jgi:hypothetical protein
MPFQLVTKARQIKGQNGWNSIEQISCCLFAQAVHIAEKRNSFGKI